MYRDLIKQYEASIKKYERTIEKATASNKERIKAIIAIFLIPLPLSFLIPDPLFKLPLIMPLFSLGLSAFLSNKFIKAYEETKTIINGAQYYIDKLESDIELMKEYDRTHTVKVTKSTKYSYDKTKSSNKETTVIQTADVKNSRGGRK